MTKKIAHGDDIAPPSLSLCPTGKLKLTKSIVSNIYFCPFQFFFIYLSAGLFFFFGSSFNEMAVKLYPSYMVIRLFCVALIGFFQFGAFFFFKSSRREGRSRFERFDFCLAISSSSSSSVEK